MKNIREYLKESVLVFDGSMGVYYNTLYNDGTTCEQASLLYPERIRQIHKSYLEAGCNAIRTNTFSANRESLQKDMNGVAASIRAAWTIAQEASEGTDAILFADIGPLPGDHPDTTEYDFIVDTFLDLGAEHFIFETFSEWKDQPRLAEKIHRVCPNAFVLATFGSLPEGFTSSGISVQELLMKAEADSNIDGTGLNCVSGPSHLLKLVERISRKPSVFAVLPNAGYPMVTRGKIVYNAMAEYFAARMAEIRAAGANIIGGCCGTNPEFIRRTVEAIHHPVVRLETVQNTEEPKARVVVNRLAEKLDRGERVIAVELDPPADDQVGFLLDGARRLRDGGVDAITIADCPIARARADSSMLAAKLRRELGIEPIPHMTCRDRNLNATRALLLGLSIEEVHNVLLVTGDPIPSADRETIKSVYNFNSQQLASYIRSLGEEGTLAPFHVFAALNVNSKNFPSELRKAQRKEENGVYGFLTQPVITEQAYENLKLARETLKGHILGGIYPIVSERNAMFMNSEVAGIDVSEEVIERYHGLDRKQGENMAVEFAIENAKRMMPYTSGWYITTPFKRVELMERILKEINKLR